MQKIKKFQSIVFEYYKASGRHDLPWRIDVDPYRVYVSEVMLQQTQVSRVIEKYQHFIATFPSVEALAVAPFSEVLSVWSGLGYNRRALLMQRAAQAIVKDYGGKIPRKPEELITLPGIGKGTAGSIPAFAYNEPTVFIETNIRRVIIHHFFSQQEEVGDEQVREVVEKTLPEGRAREWYSALMDYGTYLATVVENPNRKSTQYRKQKPFEGSVRQVRGALLRLVSKGRGYTQEELGSMLDFDQERIEIALAQLIKEGFFTVDSQGVIVLASL